MMNKYYFKISALFVVIMLSGCAGDVSDLQSYVAEVKNKSQGSVEPIPQFPPPEIYSYRSERNPFKPLDVIERQAPVAGRTPPEDRALEPLEYFPLDALSMVGTLDRGGISWGLIKDSEGKIHRVRASNHAGQNYGTITDIGPNSISITELIQDSSGLWAERISQLHIGE